MTNQNALTATDRGLKEKPEGDAPDPTTEELQAALTNSNSPLFIGGEQINAVMGEVWANIWDFVKEKAAEEGYDAFKDIIRNYFNDAPGCPPFNGRDLNQIACTSLLSEKTVFMAHTIENQTCEELIPRYKWVFKGKAVYGPNAKIAPGQSLVTAVAGLSSSVAYIYSIGDTGESAIIGFANPVRPYQNRVFVKVGPSDLIEKTNVNTIQSWVNDNANYEDTSVGSTYSAAAMTVSGSSAFFASAIYETNVGFNSWQEKYFSAWVLNDLEKEGL